MLNSWQVEQEEVVLKIIRSPKRKRSLALQIPASHTLIIRVPMRTKHDEILDFLNSHQSWITKKILLLKSEEALRAKQSSTINTTTYTREHTLAHFLKRAQWWADKLNVSFHSLTLTHAKKRWGSCSHDNRIRIHARLIQLPENLLDYVIVHELCHIRHKNHSAQFWQYVESVMPDYKKQRRMLQTFSWIL